MNKKMKRLLMRVGISAILLLLGIIFKENIYAHYTLCISSYVIVGYDIILSSAKKILSGRLFDEDFLMSIATFGAFYIGELAEGVMVMLLFQIGEFFQSYAVGKSRSSITELMNIRPDYANLLVDGEFQEVDPDDVEIGSVILIKPGEKVPIDGVVIKGSSFVDTSAITGESVPRSLSEGSEILSGFINQSGLIEVKTTKEFDESTASKILELVENASSKKARTENFITKFAKYYTPAVVIAAAMLAFLPTLMGSTLGLNVWIKRACSLLVISCPCALVISVPLSFFGGIGGAAREGILIKGSNFIEAISNVKRVVVDKTGTITRGIFTVTEVVSYDDTDILELAAYGEYNSSHPIGKSIVSAYGKKIDIKDIGKVEEFAGRGVEVEIRGKRTLIGNRELMQDRGIFANEVDSIGTLVYVAQENTVKGYIQVSDEIKKESFSVIEKLKGFGVKEVVMLTGDKKTIAEKIAFKVKIDRVFAELLPQDKVSKVEELIENKEDKEKVAFVGDGINDAPVLARADVGIAMGAIGSDAAIEAADLVIMDDDISKIATAIHLSKRTMGIVWQNIIFAIGVKFIFLGLGVLGKTELFEAVFADVGVAFIAILNAMRALKISKKPE